MKTSQQWWNEVKVNPELFNDWLVKQYRGEVTASHRIMRFAEQYAANRKQMTTLTLIADQEIQHAEWISNLLDARGIVASVMEIVNAERRYWAETLPGIDSLETGAAVAAHAEAMRLERIKVICDDPESPEDVREVFQKILVDELFHEKAFRNLASPEAMEATQANHDLGLQALGLVH